MINGKRGICHAMPWRAISFRCSFLRRALCAESEWFQWKGGREEEPQDFQRESEREREGAPKLSPASASLRVRLGKTRPLFPRARSTQSTSIPYLEFYENLLLADVIQIPRFSGEPFTLFLHNQKKIFSSLLSLDSAKCYLSLPTPHPRSPICWSSLECW